MHLNTHTLNNSNSNSGIVILNLSSINISYNLKEESTIIKMLFVSLMLLINLNITTIKRYGIVFLDG